MPTLPELTPGLYRHYKGGWYEVLDTVRCSETLQGMALYRALYGAMGLWVRPATMFGETALFEGKEQARFLRHDPALVPLDSLPTAHALMAHLQGLASRQSGITDLNATMRPPPPEPSTCCGHGCNGCVWEAFYQALHHWRVDALKIINSGCTGIESD